eukprot:CAMPEP_0184691572 /NCGR_PEP_ID=MMETSP0313-20130426/387_1 /TAXON_ID=2792 /ORGANISM="Porphyridium aerugineum, Strain SAG 1380-2" /LENGTH=280 /DNA_ID=CAMNT_0027149317 /DNA_START=323 /DNA_END=1165 /DNA_ORIENTATION=+
MTIELKRVTEDDMPRALFIQSAIHTALRFGLQDCQLAVLTDDVTHFKNELGYMSRVLDNYMILQFQGYYKVLDMKFNNVLEKSTLRTLFGKEVAARQVVLRALGSEQINVLAYKEWRQALLDVLEAENEVLLPFEVRFRPEVSLRMLVNAGNDWEYLVRYVFAKLEQHAQWNLIASLVFDLHQVLKVCTPLESQRIVPVISSTLSLDTIKRLQSIGIEMNAEQMTITNIASSSDATSPGAGANRDMPQPRMTRELSSLLRSPRELSVRNFLRSPSSSKAS